MKVLTWSYFCQTNSKSYDWKVKVTLTKSLKGCFAGASHSSLMFMYLKTKTKGRLFTCIPSLASNTWTMHLLGGTPYSLVKVSEEVDPKRVLLVEFVSICVLDCFEGLSRRSILQEDVTVTRRKKQLLKNKTNSLLQIQKSTLNQNRCTKENICGLTLWSCHLHLGKTRSWSCQTWRRSCVWRSWAFPNAPGPPEGRCPPPPPSLCRLPPGVFPSGCHQEALKSEGGGSGVMNKLIGLCGVGVLISF